MKIFKRHSDIQKDKMAIICASVFVLSALTLTGIYFAAKEDPSKEENRIDFAQLEEQQNMDEANDKRFIREQPQYAKAEESNDLDLDPEYTETNSGMIVNPGLDIQKAQETEAEATEEIARDEEEEATQEVAQASTPVYSFSDQDTLSWPVMGEVMIPYSMDQAVYFKTLNQYRLNPCIMIKAEVGTQVTCAATGVVEKVQSLSNIGNTVVIDMGNGYEAIYGQLSDICVKKGDVVKAGEVIGKVAQPTIYYTEEGANVYFQLKKDQMPVNPLERME